MQNIIPQPRLLLESLLQPTPFLLRCHEREVEWVLQEGLHLAVKLTDDAVVRPDDVALVHAVAEVVDVRLAVRLRFDGQANILHALKGIAARSQTHLALMLANRLVEPQSCALFDQVAHTSSPT